MKKQLIIAAACALAVSMPLVGCNGTSGKTSSTAATGSDTTQSESADFDAIETYYGQWRGSVATTGTSVYGTEGGSEQMLDVYLEQDGTCSVEPLEAHADLLTDTGTWEGTETEITLHLDGAGDITLSVIDGVTCEADASLFDIDGFDTIQFDFYG